MMEPQLPIFKQQNVHNKQLYLGIIKTQVSQQQWKHWQKKTASDQMQNSKRKSNYLQINSTIKKYLKHKRLCVIEQYDQQQIFNIGKYKMTVILINSEYAEQKNIFSNIATDGGTNFQLEQLQDQKILTLYDPFVITQKQINLPLNSMPWNYFSQQKKYYLGVEVWISRTFLQDCNQNYYQFKDQKMKAIQQKSYFEARSQEKLFKSLQRLILILKKLKRRDEYQFQYIAAQQKPQQARQNVKKNHEEDQDSYPLGKQEMKDLNTEGIEEKNKTISYNFQYEAGLYFDLNQCDIQPSKTPNGFKGNLKIYQSKALTWMLFREGAIYNQSLAEQSLDIPFWNNIGARLKLQFSLFLNEDIKALLFNKNKNKLQKQCKGGILADQMGLGKTIMMISLILSHRPRDNQPKQTLVIAPLSVLEQWKKKIQQFSGSKLKALVFHGSNRKINNIHEYDVIITSQSIIRSQITKSNQIQEQTLTDIDWYRVIVDQAHNFRNSSTKMAAALYSLNATYRWCLSGTPAQNSIKDMQSLLKFLQVQPWQSKQYWQKIFPKKDKELEKRDFLKLKQILKGIMLRRKKNSADSEGNNLLTLPKLDIKLVYVKMSKTARKFYRELNKKADDRLATLDKMDAYKEQNQNNLSTLQKKQISKRKRRVYNSILGLIIKMRMICCHEFLNGYVQEFIGFQAFQRQYYKFIGKKKIKRYPQINFFQYQVGSPKFKKQALTKTLPLRQVYDYWDKKFEAIKRGYRKPCQICNNMESTLHFSPCLHFFCKQCIASQLNQQIYIQEHQENQFIEKYSIKQKIKTIKLSDYTGHCPICFEELRLYEMFPVPRDNQFGVHLQKFTPNQKISQLLKYLQLMQHKDKAIIYTSFIGMIRLLSESLSKRGIRFLSLQGSDSLEKRSSAIDEFTHSSVIKVLIITLKIGSVGLNLQVANNVFIMDPWWNPSIQQQAIARAHRFGQQKQISVIKFVTEQSIEARIVKRSYSKKSMIDSILDIDDLQNDKTFSMNKVQIQQLLGADQDQVQDKNIDGNIDIQQNIDQNNDSQKDNSYLIDKLQEEQQQMTSTYQQYLSKLKKQPIQYKLQSFNKPITQQQSQSAINSENPTRQQQTKRNNNNNNNKHSHSKMMMMQQQQQNKSKLEQFEVQSSKSQIYDKNDKKYRSMDIDDD